MAGDIFTASESKFFISSAAVTSVTDTVTEYEALTWVEVGTVESISEFGDKASDVTFASLADARMRHAKGVRDAGTTTLTCGQVYDDVGQVAMIAAEQTNDNYGFKVELPDATAPLSNSIFYYRGLVTGARLNIGSADNVVKRVFEIGINSEILTDPPA
jgi:hypothetical protein